MRGSKYVYRAPCMLCSNSQGSRLPLKLSSRAPDNKNFYYETKCFSAYRYRNVSKVSDANLDKSMGDCQLCRVRASPLVSQSGNTLCYTSKLPADPLDEPLSTTPLNLHLAILGFGGKPSCSRSEFVQKLIKDRLATINQPLYPGALYVVRPSTCK